MIMQEAIALPCDRTAYSN